VARRAIPDTGRRRDPHRGAALSARDLDEVLSHDGCASS
jgi:hypothetical protein